MALNNGQKMCLCRTLRCHSDLLDIKHHHFTILTYQTFVSNFVTMAKRGYWCEVTLTFDHQIRIHFSLNMREHSCHIWRNSLQAFSGYCFHENGKDEHLNQKHKASSHGRRHHRGKNAQTSDSKVMWLTVVLKSSTFAAHCNLQRTLTLLQILTEK